MAATAVPSCGEMSEDESAEVNSTDDGRLSIDSISKLKVPELKQARGSAPIKPISDRLPSSRSQIRPECNPVSDVPAAGSSNARCEHVGAV
jgi:hypothetical protein